MAQEIIFTNGKNFDDLTFEAGRVPELEDQLHVSEARLRASLQENRTLVNEVVRLPRENQRLVQEIKRHNLF